MTFSAAPTLETERLIIRSFKLGDLEAIHRMIDQTFGDGPEMIAALVNGVGLGIYCSPNHSL